MVLKEAPFCRWLPNEGAFMFIDVPGVARLSGGSTILRPCESMLWPRGVNGGGSPKSIDRSVWPFSSSSLCGSTTGRVMVRRSTGSAATMPSIFSPMFLSLQPVSVGNKVPKRMCGGGRARDGHHLGTLPGSMANGSLGNIDSGEALGSRAARRLGGREELWADQG